MDRDSFREGFYAYNDCLREYREAKDAGPAYVMLSVIGMMLTAPMIAILFISVLTGSVPPNTHAVLGLIAIALVGVALLIYGVWLDKTKGRAIRAKAINDFVDRWEDRIDLSHLKV